LPERWGALCRDGRSRAGEQLHHQRHHCRRRARHVPGRRAAVARGGGEHRGRASGAPLQAVLAGNQEWLSLHLLGVPDYVQCVRVYTRCGRDVVLAPSKPCGVVHCAPHQCTAAGRARVCAPRLVLLFQACMPQSFLRFCMHSSMNVREVEGRMQFCDPIGFQAQLAPCAGHAGWEAQLLRPRARVHAGKPASVVGGFC